jgi:FMN phosphatase YigB (HAD superfamily)
VKKLPFGVHWVHLQTAAGIATDDSFSESSTGGLSAQETACKKMFRNVKGIIFDFDGTLFDHAKIAFHMIAANPADAIRIWKERLVRRRFAGRDFMTAEKYYRAFFAELGKICCLSPQKLRNWYYNKYMPRMVRILKKHYQPRPGLKELFQLIESPTSPVKASVYSDYPFLRERMEAIGLTASLQIQLYGPESFGAQKPAVRPFLQIAKDMNLLPEEILVIGDRQDTDGLGAFNAGMRFFCLETGKKRYFKLDPYRRPPEEEPQGPNLLMYAGTWDGLLNFLMKEKF